MRRVLALAVGIACAAALLALAERGQRAREAEAFAIVPELKYTARTGAEGAGWQEDVAPRPLLPGRRRIVCVGDSVTAGVGVAPNEAWPARLREHVGRRAVEVVNFGVTGWDASQAAALVDTRIGTWQPDLVVWGTYANDVFPTRVVVTGRSGSLVYVDAAVPPGARLLPDALSGPFLRHSALFRHVQGVWFTRRAGKVRDTGSPASWYAAQVRRATDWSARTGIPLLLVAIPPHPLAGPCEDAATCRASAAMWDTLRAGLAESGAPWLDGMEPWEGRGPFFLEGGRDGDHPNAEGHDLLAAWLAPYVTARLGAPAAPTRPGSRPPTP